MGYFKTRMKTQVTSPNGESRIIHLIYTICGQSLIAIDDEKDIKVGEKIEKLIIPSTIESPEGKIRIEHIYSNVIRINSSENGINTIDINYLYISDGIERFDDYTFYSQALLHKIRWPSTCKSIPSHCFYGCSSLKEIENIQLVENIGDEAFAFCKSLESFVWPKNCQKISEGCFLMCSKLKNISNINGVKCIKQGAFAKSGISSIEWPSKCKTIPQSCFQDSDLQSITSINNVTKIGDKAFANSQIHSFVWPEKCNRLLSKCFFKCFNLNEFIIPHIIPHLKICSVALRLTKIKELDLTNVVFLEAEEQIVPDECKLKLPFFTS